MLEEVKLLGEDLSEYCEFINTDEIRANKVDGFIALPLIVPSLFLDGMD